MPLQTVIRVSEQSQISEARRIIGRLAEDAGMTEVEKGKAAISATELATNLVRHTPGGFLFAQPMAANGSSYMELMAIDSGPGITNVARCLEDGFSSAGTAGEGLGAIRRMSSEFEIYSQCPEGTVVLSRIGNGTANGSRNGQSYHSLKWGAMCQPAPGETVSGDNWNVQDSETSIAFMIADGLGHGPAAAEASDLACRTLQSTPLSNPRAFLEDSHRALMGTRGSAIAIARVDKESRLVRYGGIGNIEGRLISGADSRGLASHNGTAGVQVRKFQEFEYPWPDHGLLVMHSDGLQSRWSLTRYPELSQRHPAVIAGVLWRDFTRGRDDVTVLVARFNNGARVRHEQ